MVQDNLKPYVQGTGTQQQSYASQNTSTSYVPSSSVYVPGQSSATPSAPIAPTAPSATSGYSSSYGVSTSTYTPASSTYTPSSSTYTPSSTYAPAPASSTPSFSQALNVPPPAAQTHTQSHAGSPAVVKGSYVSGSSGGSYPTATVVSGGYNAGSGSSAAAASPYNNSSATTSNPNSSAYGGVPTNRLVRQGNPSQCHNLSYEIKGNDMQLVEIALDTSKTVIAEAGAMMFLEDGIDFKAKFGDGSTPKQGFFKKILSAGGRLLTGESLFLTHFTNKGQPGARVAFAAPYPGTLLPINMADYGGTLICQKDAFVCAAFGTKLTIHFNKRLGSGLFGGEGFILQKLKGDGMAFIHAGGTVIKKELNGGRLRVDTGCLVGFTEGMSYDIQLVPGLKSILFGGEGLFLVTLQGHGTVWLQSLPFSRMADRIIRHAPSIGGQRQGEGSALGGLGGILDGDGW